MPDVTVKDILYEQINKIPESQIQQEFAGKNFTKIINQILEGCILRIAKMQDHNDDTLGTFAESLLHYLLTNALIPSQRKTSIKNTELDIVIPDSKTLSRSPKDALVLHFVKTKNQEATNTYLEKLQQIQPVKENIWLIAETTVNTEYKTYEIKNKTFVNILDDINKFVSSKPQVKFRIFKT